MPGVMKKHISRIPLIPKALRSHLRDKVGKLIQKIAILTV
jgi:hypothetical protein